MGADFDNDDGDDDDDNGDDDVAGQKHTGHGYRTKPQQHRETQIPRQRAEELSSSLVMLLVTFVFYHIKDWRDRCVDSGTADAEADMFVQWSESVVRWDREWEPRECSREQMMRASVRVRSGLLLVRRLVRE